MNTTANLGFGTAMLVAATVGCGDGAICPSEVLVTISSPFDGVNLTNADDRDLDRPGIQFNVPVRSNLPPGSHIELRIEVVGDANETVILAATADDDGAATFEDVTLPFGEVLLRANSAEDNCGDAADGITVNVIEATTRPEAVTILDVTSPARNRVDASWLMPISRIAGYIVKVADEPITETNFNIVGTELAPPSSDDDSPSISVSPLRPGTTYFVGIATLDDEGTRSVAVVGGPIVPDFATVEFGRPGGGATDDSFGAEVANGDLNADGAPDVVMAAAGGDGSVYVFFGGASGLATAPDVTISGAATANLGAGIAVLDWNGDGDDDLAVGAPFEAPCPSFCDGAVFVFYGGLGFAGSLDKSDANVTINVSSGSTAFDQAGIGSSVVAARFDGDARDDLVIGGFAASSGDGVVAVLYGGTNETTISLDETSATPMGTARGWYFEEPGFYAGSSTPLFGDRLTNLGPTEGLNDATDDVGVAYFDNTSAVVLRGRNQPGSFGLFASAFSPATDLRIEFPAVDFEGGGDDRVQFGGTIATIPDMNGDGAVELVIGAWRAGDDSGRVFVVDGDAVGNQSTTDSGFVLVDIAAQTANAFFGSALAVGDVDGDGSDDLLVGGASPSSGNHALFIWYSAAPPLGSITPDQAHDIREGPTGFVADLPADKTTPTQATFVGDVDGDGLPDLCWADWNGVDGGSPDTHGVLQFLR